jgi:hypothetical protein
MFRRHIRPARRVHYHLELPSRSFTVHAARKGNQFICLSETRLLPQRHIVTEAISIFANCLGACCFVNRFIPLNT